MTFNFFNWRTKSRKVCKLRAQRAKERDRESGRERKRDSGRERKRESKRVKDRISKRESACLCGWVTGWVDGCVRA